MTWEELNDLALPLFREVYSKVMSAAFEIQKNEDRKSKIGINPVEPGFPEAKFHDLIYKIYEYLKEEEQNGS